MRTWWLLLALLLVLGGALAYTNMQPERDDGHGLPHPDVSSMLRGGTSERHANIAPVAWVYGGTQLVLYTTVLSIGFRTHRLAVAAIWSAGLVYMLVFAALMVAYGSASQPIVLGFPLATAWLIYGLWPVPTLFVVIYIFGFRSWVMTAEATERFAELVASRKENG